VGLASTGSKSYFLSTNSFGRRWLATKVPALANAMACTSLAHCVLVGEVGSAKPWFATEHDHQFSSVSLIYVPSPLVSVACSAKVCTAIGVTTVLAYRP
jgi:hypothetical protein